MKFLLSEFLGLSSSRQTESYSLCSCISTSLQRFLRASTASRTFSELLSCQTPQRRVKRPAAIR